MIDKEKFAELAKKYLDGTATSAEREFLEALYARMDTGKPIEAVLGELQAQQLKTDMFDNIQGATNRPEVISINRNTTPVIHRRRMFLRYGAVAASLIAVSLLWILLRDQSAAVSGNGLKTVYVQTGGLKKLQLADGSSVWLNAKSKLSYASKFGENGQRDVYLEGEAYFEVKKDPQRPFLVHTQGLTTRVLGTKFDVKAYDPKATEVTLVEGKVMLTAARPVGGVSTVDTLFLAPNEKALFVAGRLQHTSVAKEENDTPSGFSQQRRLLKDSTRDIAQLSKQLVANAADYSSWRNGEIIFNEESLGSVLETLGRKLDVSIKASPDLLDCPVSLRVTTESIDDILFEITRQVKRKTSVGGLPKHVSVQYKKSGNDYYIE
jgi:transmembrane sensor